MSLKQELQEAAKRPVDYTLLHKKQQEINEAFRTFLHGDLSQQELKQYLRLVEEEFSFQGVELYHAGPLYGLLRKYINLTKEETAPWVAEERAHYFEARERDLDPLFEMYFSEDNTNPEVIHRFHILVRYSLTRDMTPEEMKDTILAVTLAPDEPSEYDLSVRD